MCEVYLYVVGARLAREEPCAGRCLRCEDRYVLVKIGGVAVGVGSETCGVDKVPVCAEALKHGEVEIAHFARECDFALIDARLVGGRDYVCRDVGEPYAVAADSIELFRVACGI